MDGVNPKRIALTALAAATGAWLTRAAWGVPGQIGASRSRIQPYAGASPTYRDYRFHNSEPSGEIPAGASAGIAKSFVTRGSVGRPRKPIPLATPIAPAEAGALAVTWYGHSSVLVEVDGYRVLADPVWSDRVSPSASIGPARLHPIPVALGNLPAVDAIVISHDHYDHLDKATVQQLASRQSAPFVVPIGIGAHLRRWRVPEDRIVELDWDESVTLGGLVLTCTEARHFSGRGLVRNPTQWASWVIAGPERRVFFGGDSGYTPRFARLGESYGPFDLTLLPVGAYDDRWRDIHMNPEEAVRTHADLNGGDGTHGRLVPVHWATFNLAFHPWSEPIVRLTTAAGQVGTEVSVPVPGQRIDVTRPATHSTWWQHLS
ncbi:L-ascorbate metabolism protein UlaG, beta-lactamase superfamily [Rhodococcus triatomae]|uniref:L-ascorbate metabolism protein UlaG, beta-lactamase superfamily n=1 Tax=Rhodococcus triatomae TaxID=300028 RepID=A0A1G8API1_9NOCA|nr:L-ascorbate metabolism protein UlaG, beta-lactamase superfamily [Rhodococcus triatomae]